MLRKTLTLTGALLVAFHIWLFGSQVWDGQLLDLTLVTRWAIAAGLLAALFHLHRRGISVIRSRQAIAVWLLTATLHGPALARDLDLTAPAMPEVVATLAQTTATLTGLATLILFGLAFLLRGQRPALLSISRIEMPAVAGALPPASFLAFAPRPPPAN
ncbi:MAG TPA: hypothetical protein PKW63_17630 [Vicinamibacterales bacterium]|jgi:hypothetical protein|nr:hypothetical protein [Acidobacteriota bacterium]HQX83593.1 hypothetical protein [Vicinamibacterales bacterium]